MKLISVFGLIVILCYSQLTLADGSCPVKILEYMGDYVNSSYIDAKTWKNKLIKVNETYNRLYVKLKNVKDLPADTTLAVILYRSKSKDGPWKFVNVYQTKVCDKNDKNWKYLPLNINSWVSSGGKSCLHKVCGNISNIVSMYTAIIGFRDYFFSDWGDYEIKDAGIFKYYEILTGGEGYYYAIMNIGYAGNVILSITRSRSQWRKV